MVNKIIAPITLAALPLLICACDEPPEPNILPGSADVGSSDDLDEDPPEPPPPEVHGPCEAPWTEQWEVTVVAEGRYHVDSDTGPVHGIAVTTSTVGLIYREGVEDSGDFVYNELRSGSWSTEVITGRTVKSARLLLGASGEPWVGMAVDGLWSPDIYVYSRGEDGWDGDEIYEYGQRFAVAKAASGVEAAVHDLGGIFHVAQQGGDWATERAVSEDDDERFEHVDLAIDSQGGRTIAYRVDHEEHSEIRFAARVAGEWQDHWVADAWPDSEVSLIIDAQDRRHIGFVARSGVGTVATHLGGQSWAMSKYGVAPVEHFELTTDDAGQGVVIWSSDAGVEPAERLGVATLYVDDLQRIPGPVLDPEHESYPGLRSAFAATTDRVHALYFTGVGGDRWDVCYATYAR